MAAPAIASGTPTPAQPPSTAPNAESFDQQVAKQASAQPVQPNAKSATPPGPNGANGAQTPAPESTAADEAAFQEQVFESFAGDVDKPRQERLSKWLPDLLNGDPKALAEAAKGLTHEQASDLNSLALKHGISATARGVQTPGQTSQEAGSTASLANAINGLKGAVVNLKGNLEPLQQLQQRFGEHALKEATPGLAPTASYDVEATLQATKDRVYEEFVSGVDEPTRKYLETWFKPALADRSQLPTKPTDSQGAALHKLAVLHGFGDADALQKSVVAAYDRAVALETAGEPPSVIDMLLVKDHGKPSGGAASLIDGSGVDLDQVIAGYEKSEFAALDSWLPDALAGRGEAPTGDAEAMALLRRFAERMDIPNSDSSTPEQMLNALKDSRAFTTALQTGKTNDNESFLLFSDTFLENTVKYGAQNGAVNVDIMRDAAIVAETLLGPDDGSGGTREVPVQALQAALLHRTDETLTRPQEVMAASAYINSAETLAEQKTRLTESLLAFHVREEIGTPPMSARDWATSYEEVHPELVDHLGKYAWNHPTHEKMQIVTQHLGVPGKHEFMIDKKREITIYNDDLGNTTDVDYKKHKKKWYKSVIDIAVPVVATALTFTGWGTAAGIALNTAYSAYKGAEAIKNGDLLGGALAIAGGLTGGAASYANVAGSAFAGAAGAISTASKVVNVANASLTAHRAIESGDYLGALTAGLGGAAAGGAGSGFQTAAKGIDVGRSIKDGEYLDAAAGAASIASDLSADSNSKASTAFDVVADGIQVGQSIDEGDYLAAGAGLAGIGGDIAAHNRSESAFAFEGIEHGFDLADAIENKDYEGIGRAASGLVQTGGEYRDFKQDQALIEAEKARLAEIKEQQRAAAEDGPHLGPDGQPIILPASFTNPDGTPATNAIEIADGDTLSQIAERHGVSVDDLLAANPDITDPNRIQAGQQLNLPEGVQPVGNAQQQKLDDFANVTGGTRGIEGPAGEPLLSPADGARSIADAEFGVAIEVYQRDFNQALDKELTSVNEQIADIDRQLAEGVNHAPVAYHLKNERLKLQAQQRDLQEIADNPNAAFEALNASREDGWTASDIGHTVLDIAGLAPVVGEWADALNAAWYFSEGDVVNGTLSSLATAPVAGIGPTLGKWGIQTGGRILDLKSPEAWEAADAAYDIIRQTDDVGVIAENTGWPVSRVERVKDHLFNKVHQLDSGTAQFDADPAIANAWNRLQSGTQNANDMKLLQHELFESKFEGIFKTDYRTAHEATIKSGRDWEWIE